MEATRGLILTILTDFFFCFLFVEKVGQVETKLVRCKKKRTLGLVDSTCEENVADSIARKKKTKASFNE